MVLSSLPLVSFESSRRRDLDFMIECCVTEWTQNRRHRIGHATDNPTLKNNIDLYTRKALDTYRRGGSDAAAGAVRGAREATGGRVTPVDGLVRPPPSASAGLMMAGGAAAGCRMAVGA